ncbi:MAG: 3-oxoacyl-[acyl-carrier-protein] reductase [Acidobacteriota bacterium]
MPRFTNRVALVTGAAQGIGYRIAELLASEGAWVFAGDLNREALDRSVKALEEKGLKAEALALNVADRASCEAAVQEILQKAGRLELLVNNAGITRDALLMRMKPEDWELVLAVNLTGAFHLTQLAVKAMAAQRFGRIVNLASVVGLMGNPGQANYVASKAGIVGLTKVVAREMASRNITCNAVAPGFIVTPMTDVLTDAQKEQMAALIPLKRFGTPDDVARAVAFLLSEDAAYITGQTLSVNGGMYM